MCVCVYTHTCVWGRGACVCKVLNMKEKIQKKKSGCQISLEVNHYMNKLFSEVRKICLLTIVSYLAKLNQIENFSIQTYLLFFFYYFLLFLF